MGFNYSKQYVLSTVLLKSFRTTNALTCYLFVIAGKSKRKNISKGPLHSKGISVDLRPTCVDTSTEDYPRRICLAFKPTTGWRQRYYR